MHHHLLRNSRIAPLANTNTHASNLSLLTESKSMQRHIRQEYVESWTCIDYSFWWSLFLTNVFFWLDKDMCKMKLWWRSPQENVAIFIPKNGHLWPVLAASRPIRHCDMEFWVPKRIDLQVHSAIFCKTCVRNRDLQFAISTMQWFAIVIDLKWTFLEGPFSTMAGCPKIAH